MTETTQLPIVDIYTDGACKGNPGAGGWGAVLIYKNANKTHRKKINGFEPMTTNNKMELTAAIKALEDIKEDYSVNITTDSNYVKDGITKWLTNWKKNNWRNSQKKLVKNKDLWQKLDELNAKHKVNWFWVKGHSGHKENELADQLANDAIEQKFHS